MVKFFGKTNGKVDDKGRIVLPAIYRDAMSRSGEQDPTMVIKKSVQGDCLNLYTLEEWSLRSDKVLEGLDPELAETLALQTVLGTAKLMAQTPFGMVKSAVITFEVVS